MGLGGLEKFHPNAGLRQYARSKTFAAIALAIGISVSKRVKRIREQRNGVVGANGSRPGITLPGGRLFIPTTTRTITDVTRVGDQVFTIQYEQPEGITLQLSRGSVVPATSYLSLSVAGPATFTIGRVITTVDGGTTQVMGGTTSVISPTATVTSQGRTVTLGPSTTIVGASTRISGGSTRTAYTSVPFTVTNSASSEAPSSSMKVLIYNDPGGGVIVVPAEQSSSSRRIITLSSVSSTRTSSVPSYTSAQSSQVAGPPSGSSALASSRSSAAAPSPSSGGGGGGGGGTGQTYTGDATYYDPGLGSCGITNSASDLIAAIGHALFDSMATANSNNNPFCGRQIIIRKKGGFSRRSNVGDLRERWIDSNNTLPVGRVRTFATRTRTGAKLLETTASANITRGAKGHAYPVQLPLYRRGKSTVQEGYGHALKRRGEVVITVVDRCGGCAEHDLDLSPAAFNMIADPAKGRVPIDWRFA
ncbi:hypothetical protein TWF730_000725 [Orbilia blumenaviensis]|uniref:RlpA-like protein double-psi beta-barrel domain-containing protein n=1 Tax=Orbilia blumenaviensis TaxID=1796055 RepID=A0AAV9VPJ5_9PEZI